MALERVAAGSNVLDIGCASGYVARALSANGCRVTGIDRFPAARDLPLEHFIQHDLDGGEFPVDVARFQYVLLLDVIEHLRSPEGFVEMLRKCRKAAGDTTFIVSTGNVAFVITRLMLLLGFFNYGSRGILDLTHTRLFTFSTMKSLFEQAGYKIDEVKGVPAPFALALGDGATARFLLAVNKALIHLSKSLFSYQIFMVVKPLPSLEWLLERAAATSKDRSDSKSVSSVY
jgi:SAM-dependent methyltransferase